MFFLQLPDRMLLILHTLYEYMYMDSKFVSEQKFESVLFCFAAGEIKDLPLALHVPVVYPCMPSEQLRITIDAQRGMLLASLPSIGKSLIFGKRSKIFVLFRNFFKKFFLKKVHRQNVMWNLWFPALLYHNIYNESLVSWFLCRINFFILLHQCLNLVFKTSKQLEICQQTNIICK